MKNIDKNEKKWIPEKDACNEFLKCQYFLDDYWNCQGEKEPCHEFVLSIWKKSKNDTQ